MPDREKVVGHLNDCMEESRRDNTWVFVRKDIVKDAIALLKAQEAKSVESIQVSRDHFAELTGYCPSCKRPMRERFNRLFCGNCGQAVKWE